MYLASIYSQVIRSYSIAAIVKSERVLVKVADIKYNKVADIRAKFGVNDQPVSQQPLSTPVSFSKFLYHSQVCEQYPSIHDKSVAQRSSPI